jgi:hypothetical protein
MGIMAVKVLAIWFLVALVTGFALGAVIRKGVRIPGHGDREFRAIVIAIPG